MTPYDRWGETYELFEGPTATRTWEQGVVRECGTLLGAGALVLDVGAGTGIGARLLRQAVPDCQVVSLDRSTAMLDAGGVPEEDRIVADMADFQVQGRVFDAVVSGFDALNYLTLEGLDGFLASASACLRPGGHLVFDYSSRKVLAHDWRDLSYSQERGGFVLKRRHRYEDRLQRSRTTLELWRGGELLWREVHDQYSVDPFTIDELARYHGLDILRVRDIDGERFSPACTTHVYVAQKR